MPFRLKNARATYQRLVNRMFKELIEDTMEVYIDDKVVKSHKGDDHIVHLERTFSILRQHPLQVYLWRIIGKVLRFPCNQTRNINKPQLNLILAHDELAQKVFTTFNN